MKVFGALRPLFDRLQDDEPDVTEEVPVANLLSLDALKVSIFNEIMRILNTRYTGRDTHWDDTRAMAVELNEAPDRFGFPDFSSLDPTSVGNWDKIAQRIVLTIERFEPRLMNGRVEVQGFDGQTQTLACVIDGDVLFDEQKVPINFPLSIQASYYKNR